MDESKKLKPFGEIPESFRGLKTEGIYYVDKTGFIPYLISQKRKICVVTRPRRFGKTLMLRTLQTFFEYALDKDGKPVDNRHYFEGLNVMDAGEDVLKEMGKYPVISLSFKDVSGRSYQEIVEQLNDAVRQACQPHKRLFRESGVLSDVEKGILQSFQDGVPSEANLRQFLGLYTQWLKDVTDRETVILLDEYDVPLQKAAIYDIHYPGGNLFDKTVGLIGKFISAGFKSNSNLAYGIIAGCMRVAKESIFTGMNNPGVITVLDEIPDEYWGFTEAEVKKMLSYYNIDNWYERIEQWYDGYFYSGRKVFNPWSLLNAIRGLVNGYGENAIKAYWGQTSSNDIIDEIIDKNPQHRESLANLMNGETMTVPVFDNFSYRDLKQNPEAIWSFLLYTGYLKAIKVGKDERNRMRAEVAVPNEEIWTIMDSSMERWWKDIRLATYDARPLMEAMDAGDVEGMERSINILLDNGMSCFDYNEAFYHGTLYALMSTLASRVKSNAEFGNGRPDLVVVWQEKAFVLELKRVTGKELEAAKSRYKDLTLDAWDIEDICMQSKLDEAEKQIKDGRYIKGVLRENPAAREAVCYGIAFCRKRCMVRKV
ncbi:MAG: AAA family ATPase [Proteobacteria bacterium]|nr:AAA family ATPase [Pseudomonadota bacterium]